MQSVRGRLVAADVFMAIGRAMYVSHCAHTHSHTRSTYRCVARTFLIRMVVVVVVACAPSQPVSPSITRWPIKLCVHQPTVRVQARRTPSWLRCEERRRERDGKRVHAAHSRCLIYCATRELPWVGGFGNISRTVSASASTGSKGNIRSVRDTNMVTAN